MKVFIVTRDDKYDDTTHFVDVCASYDDAMDAVAKDGWLHAPILTIGRNVDIYHDTGEFTIYTEDMDMNPIPTEYTLTIRNIEPKRRW